MVANLDLYEALKTKLGEKAARMVADVVPAAGDLATKADIDGLAKATKADINRLEAATKADINRLEAATKADINRLEAATRTDINRLEVRLEQMETRLLRWTLTFFVPLWVSMLATMWALLLRA